MSDLKGKFAVVTGAGKGIGAAIAARFLREQAAGVAIWDYDLCLAEQTAVQLGGTSLSTTALAAILEWSPTLKGPSTLAPEPTITPLPMVGWRFPCIFPVPPRVTPW